jgi:CrcB protein
MDGRAFLLVASGGALGSVLRYAVSTWAQSLVPVTVLPIGTAVVNATGSLLIGLLAGLVEFRQLLGPGARLLLVVGVLGGYTTFSAFSMETVALFRSGHAGAAVTNVVLQVGLGIAAALAGLAMARSL